MDKKLRIASPQEPPLQASRWLFSPALLDATELRSLFDELGDFCLFKLGAICKPGDEEIDRLNFLNTYSNYVESLMHGQVPTGYPSIFTCALTAKTDHLCAVQISPEKHLVRIIKPVIQVQPLTIDYSQMDKKFRTMIMGGDTITWGLQWSFPQLAQDPKTHEVLNIRNGQDYPNAEVFKRLQRWIRNNTSPTPMIADGQLTNLPVRLGKKCFAWINRHPQLHKKGLSVKDNRLDIV